MKTNLYLLVIFVVWTLSCENRKQPSDNEGIAQQVTFPYQLDSVPATWVFHQTDWFEFHLPPDWQLSQRPTLDSYVMEICSPDSTVILRSDDYGFGLQQAGLSNTGWPEDILEVDTLSGTGQLYYNLDRKVAALILYESYWVSTGDALTATQFETACMILQTVRLQPNVFSSDYFNP